ncbi:MAG: glycosyl transferase family protein [Candidatus Omnitrophota bacterium]
MPMVDYMPLAMIFFMCMLWFVSIVFLISGLDDFLIDVFYFVRVVYRKIFITPKYPPLREEQLHEIPERLLAVMIPAWNECGVINAMLSNTLKNLDYKNYHIFIGVYPNDFETRQEVEKIKKEYRNVHCIVCPHNGPTNKADCLNWVYNGIRLFEKVNNACFEIFVIQDCEDMIHPLSYKVFNYLIPRKDMVQLPVFSFTVKWYEFTGGHYIDEFAQSHYKDIVVREMLDKCLPSAGVGCAFSRKAVLTLEEDKNHIVFNTDSLTEDYDLGLRMKKYGLKQIFAKICFPRVRTIKPFGGFPAREVVVKEYICVQEYFPNKFWASARQKSRWVIGIALQGWKTLGWGKSLSSNYMLFRDRKALITNFVNLLGYLIVIFTAVVWISGLGPESYQYPSLFSKGSAIWYIILMNFMFFIIRIFERAYCVQRIYGWKQSFLSFPRMIWGNFINFVATSRAVFLYARHMVTGKAIAWDKTIHRYPTEEEMEAYQKNMESSVLDPDQG